MRLRSSLEMCLPVRDDEAHLSPEARKLAFRGRYTFTQFEGVQITTDEKGLGTEKPYVHSITRSSVTGEEAEFRIVSTSTGLLNRHYGDRQDNVVAEVNEPAAVNRIRRIEKIAKYLKASAAGVAAAAAIVVVAESGVLHKEPEVRPCEQVIQGDEILEPVPDGLVEDPTLQGQVACQIDGHDYAILHS